MFAYLACMCALADAQFASPIASGRGCSIQRGNDNLSARSLARPETLNLDCGSSFEKSFLGTEKN